MVARGGGGEKGTERWALIDLLKVEILFAHQAALSSGGADYKSHFDFAIVRLQKCTGLEMNLWNNIYCYV